MIALRNLTTKIAKENEPLEIPKEFPSRLELAMNYTRCYAQFLLTFDIFNKSVITIVNIFYLLLPSCYKLA